VPERPSVMISSTIVDLPEHREEVKDACLRQGTFPLMMEEESASYDPIQFSMNLVNRADIYVGVYAHRNSYVPPRHDISLTEIEYMRATCR